MQRRRRVKSSSPDPGGAIGQRLRRLSEWALASCFTAAIGCGEELPGKLIAQLSPSSAPARLMPCPDLLLVAEPVHPDAELDYIGVIGGRNNHEAFRILLADYGEPCKSARDRDACLLAIEQAIQAPDCEGDVLSCKRNEPVLGRSPVIVTTSGDDVARHETVDTLRRVLGDVDTASEAVLFAQLHGLHAVCAAESSRMSNPGILVQATERGWRVQSRWLNCGTGPEGEQIIELDRDGRSEGFEHNVDVGIGPCTWTARRPAGLQLRAAGTSREPIASFLARSAQLEAASVPAFLRLSRELSRLGAHALAAAARRSAHDELRHAVSMGRLAARYGAAPLQPMVAAARCGRTAYEIAQENAVEGCVRETFGALVAWQQSALAPDPSIARTMRTIAADETRHAELSWQVAGWIEPKLTATERKMLGRARAGALGQLQREIAMNPLPRSARAQLGLPSRSQQQVLLQRMAAVLGVG